jgi:hypothetical protein
MNRDGRGSALKIVVVLIVLLLVAVILITPAAQNAISQFLLSPFQEKVPAYANYRLERTLSVDANAGTIDSFTLDVPLPRHVTGDGYSLQQVLSVSASPHGDQVLRYGDEWMVWEHGMLTGTQTFTVYMTYEIRVDTQVWDIDAQDAGTTEDVPLSVRDDYLHNEWATDDGWMIDMSSMAIKQKAQEIVGNETNAFVILERIYKWTIKNIGYTTLSASGMPKTSEQTMESMIGDCDDQAMLFCSLARASGVPAWIQLGALYDKGQDDWFGHGWVQAYVPLKDGGSETVVIDTVNRDFMRWMPNRIVEYTDDGNGEHLSDFYYSFNYYYDEGSYPPGQGPSYEEGFISLEHSESLESVTVGSLFDNVRACMQAPSSGSRLRATAA